MDEDRKTELIENESRVTSGFLWQVWRLVKLWLKMILVVAVPSLLVIFFADNLAVRLENSSQDIEESAGLAIAFTGIFGGVICFWIGIFRLVVWLFSGVSGQGNVTVIQEAIPTDVATEIAKYHELFEKGIISQEEFDQKKSELL